MFKPRPAQEEILKYTGGWLGVSAVPGSGKTNTLAYLAAQTGQSRIRDDQEVLVVTFTNSGVDNFNRRIREFLNREMGLIPDVAIASARCTGWRTTSSTSARRCWLAGRFSDRRRARVQPDPRRHCGELGAEQPEALEEFIAENVPGDRRRWIERERWPDLVRSIAAGFIRRAKDLQATPAELRQKLPDWHGDWRWRGWAWKFTKTISAHWRIAVR